MSALRLLFLIGALCLTHSAMADGPVRVLTSIKPLQLIVMAVGGDAIRAEALLAPQFSPHDYQLRPSDRAKLNDAEVIFWVGPRLEAFLQPVLSALAGRRLIVSLQDADADPHIWMDPIATIQIAHRMAVVLATLRPERRAYFIANADRLAATLGHQDAVHRAQLKQLPALRGFMVSHDAYTRFERRYGLAHRAALTNVADMPPSAKSLLNIEHELSSGAISCIWRQPLESKLLQRLVAGSGIRSVTIDLMASQTPLTGDGVAQFYQRMWDEVITCLTN